MDGVSAKEVELIMYTLITTINKSDSKYVGWATQHDRRGSVIYGIQYGLYTPLLKYGRDTAFL